MSNKNLRLLGMERPAAWQPTISETILALQAELEKGELVYSADELKTLKGKLEEYEFMLRRIMEP